MIRLPILVQFEYHTDAVDAACLAEHLHYALNDDPAVPGLRIPTLFIPQDGTDDMPKPRMAPEADRVLVVVLAEDHLAAHAQRSSASGRTWADYIVRLRELCDQSDSHRFMPVQLTQHACSIDARLEDLNFLRVWDIDDEKKRCRVVARRIIQLLLRRLQPHQSPEDAPPLTIFLSHTKPGTSSTPRRRLCATRNIQSSSPKQRRDTSQPRVYRPDHTSCERTGVATRIFRTFG